MARNIYDDGDGWKSGDTSTFAKQSQNLAEQAGQAGINQGQIDVEKGTGQAYEQAGQTARNIGQGASDVAKGAQVSPTIAQGQQQPSVSPEGGAQPQIQPYTVTQTAPAAPSTDIQSNPSFAGNTSYNDDTTDYLMKLFPNGLPDSVQSALNQGDFGNMSQSFQDYVNGLNSEMAQINNPNADEVTQFQNYLNNRLATQQQDLGQNYQKQQSDITSQMNDKQKAISDYINSLNEGLKDYQKRTGDLSNVGNLSNEEAQAIARNAVLTDTNQSNAAKLGAIASNVGSTRLAALSQQAQNAAIQSAIGRAAQAQQQDKLGQAALEQGQKEQAKGYTDANTAIQKNQTDTLNKLQDNGTKANKALTDLYNSTNSNLSKGEQDYVNRAQDILRTATVPPQAIKTAVQSFADTVGNYLKNNKLNDQQKSQLKNQLEAIWRISVGSHPADMGFSDEIAGILNPIVGDITK